MRVQAVVARYCEDLSWVATLPSEWEVQVYDKSRGGPRQTVETHWYKSPGGPDSAPLLPGAVPLENIGAEAHTYAHHVRTRYAGLADVTLFLQGDPRQFVTDVPGEYAAVVARAAARGFAAAGPFLDCDDLGRPHHDRPLGELRDMWACFTAEPLPRRLEWHASAQFAVTADRLRRWPEDAWDAVVARCRTKLHACAMERLWFELLGKERGK